LATFLVTGAAGFIGSHIVAALVARGDSVRAFDNLSTGLSTNLDPLRPHIDFRLADLADPAALASACRGVDTIFHQAAIPSVPRSVADPLPSHRANLDGTFNLLLAAQAANVRRVVYAASSSAYGNQPGFPRLETMPPQPLSPYAVQKLTGEFYCQSFHTVYGLQTVCLRYFNVFGPRQDPSSAYSGVVARFARQMLSGQTPTIFGDGQQGRDFTYIDNVVAANLLAAHAPAESCAGRVFNIACGQRHTLLETYAALAQLIGFPHPPQFAPARTGDVTDSFADIALARHALGFTPSIDFHTGLQRTLHWYRQQLLLPSSESPA
jgi:nucleoside-diphosphate-sugar epimerase